MSSNRGATRAAWLLAGAITLGTGVAAAQAPELRLDMQADVNAVGDVNYRVVMKMPPSVYNERKGQLPNPMVLVRDMTSGRADQELAPGAVARWDDLSSSLVIEATELGATKNLGGGLWEGEVDDPQFEFMSIGPGKAGRQAAVFAVARKQEDGSLIRGKASIHLPAGASAPEWDAERRVVLYRKAFAGAAIGGALAQRLKVKDRLLSGCYKVYGLGKDAKLGDEIAAQWVAKVVFKNTGTGAVRDLRVRFKLDGYADWDPWQRFAEVIPGQTVVALYYPIFDPGVAKIKSNTPSNVRLEWSLPGPGGARVPDEDAKRVTLLGVNEFVFGNLTAGESLGTYFDETNNAPLLASFVARNDPIVTQFAVLANKRAGGVAAGADDESAGKALKGAYELLVANDFTYQYPPGLVDRSKSYDEKMVQNLKFPRDTIRDKSGTCIDLAMLYASMIHSIGGGRLKPLLALVPGHAFPVVVLPSGRPVGVETTLVGGGFRDASKGVGTFEAAVELGSKELQEWHQKGLIRLLDFQDLWTKGIANPELEDLPADILQRWGIKEGGRLSAAQPPRQTEPERGTAPGRRSTHERREPYAGRWSGQATESVEGREVTYPVIAELESEGAGRYSGAYRARLQPPGQEAVVDVTAAVTGRASARGLRLRTEQITVKNTNTGETKQLEQTLLVEAQLEAEALVGRIGNETQGWTRFRLVRE